MIFFSLKIWRKFASKRNIGGGRGGIHIFDFNKLLLKTHVSNNVHFMNLLLFTCKHEEIQMFGKNQKCY